jgi:nitroreductase
MTTTQESPMLRGDPAAAVIRPLDCSGDEVTTDGLDSADRVELYTRAIAAAVRAPSSHNTQPWEFRIRWGALELHVDRSRVLPVTDPACRELVISCGAALQNIRLSLRHEGFAGKIDILPYSSNPDVLARIQPGEHRPPRVLDELLFRSITKRHTNRAAFYPMALSEHLIAALVQAAEVEGAWLQDATHDGLRPAIVGLVAAGDREQWADRDFRRELAAWMRSDTSDAPDGIPTRALGLPAAVARFAPSITPWLPLGKGQCARDVARAMNAPFLAVLGTDGDSPRDWLAAGQALQVILLVAAAHGVSASFLNQPLQRPQLRARVRTLLGGTGSPQMVIRMGFAPEPTDTPRRTVREVLG